MLLNAEDSWLQRLSDPSAPLPSTDQRYDGGSHDLNTPVKNLWVQFTDLPLLCFPSLHLLCLFQLLTSPPITHRNPLGLPISKRDSLLEKCAMFREAGGTLSRQPSQDNGLDGPFSSGASKLEQVPCFLTRYKKHSKMNEWMDLFI